jgi:hypothetical protein
MNFSTLDSTAAFDKLHQDLEALDLDSSSESFQKIKKQHEKLRADETLGSILGSNLRQDRQSSPSKSSDSTNLQLDSFESLENTVVADIQFPLEQAEAAFESEAKKDEEIDKEQIQASLDDQKKSNHGFWSQEVIIQLVTSGVCRKCHGERKVEFSRPTELRTKVTISCETEKCNRKTNVYNIAKSKSAQIYSSSRFTGIRITQLLSFFQMISSAVTTKTKTYAATINTKTSKYLKMRKDLISSTKGSRNNCILCTV